MNIVRRSEWYQRRAAYINPSLRNNHDTAFFEATSAYQLPIKVFSTPMPADMRRPDGLDDFVDAAHFEKIKRADPRRAAVLL